MSVQRSFDLRVIGINTGTSPIYSDTFSLEGVGVYTLQGISQNAISASAWDSGTSYNPGDVVEYNGSYYICTIANTGAQPDISADWSLYQSFIHADLMATSVEGDVAGKPLEASFNYINGIICTPTATWSATSGGSGTFAYKWGRIRFYLQPSPNDAPGNCFVTVTLQEV